MSRFQLAKAAWIFISKRPKVGGRAIDKIAEIEYIVRNENVEENENQCWKAVAHHFSLFDHWEMFWWENFHPKVLSLS